MSKSINNGYVLSSVQFDATSGDTAPINEVVKCTTPALVNAWIVDPSEETFYEDEELDLTFRDRAPSIQVPMTSGTGYNIYYYVADARDSKTRGNVGPGWVNNGGFLTADVIPVGYGIWTRGFKDGTSEVTDTGFTFAGAVKGDSSVQVSLAGDFKLRSNPYPTTKSINDIADWAALSLPVVNAWIVDPSEETYYEDEELDPSFKNKAATIQVPMTTGVGYNIYYYVADARDSKTRGNVGAGWVNNGGFKTSDAIPVGSGAWIKTCLDVSKNVTFVK